jgi:hypothetical protein
MIAATSVDCDSIVSESACCFSSVLEAKMNFYDPVASEEMDEILDSLIAGYMQIHETADSTSRVCSDPVRRLYKTLSPSPPKSFVKRRSANHTQEAANTRAAALSVSAHSGLESQPH